MIEVSIVISTYNRVNNLKKYLEPNINAAKYLSNSSVNYVVYVWDNASTDGTEAYCLTLHNDNFRYHRNIQNVGILGNPIIAAKNIDADYIWVIGDDDLLNIKSCAKLNKSILLKPDLLYLNYNPIKQNAFFNYTPNTFYRDSERLSEIRNIVTVNKNFFTAHYTLCMKKTMAIDVFSAYDGGEYFSNIECTIPTSTKIISDYLGASCVFVSDPVLDISLDVSWGEHKVKWNLSILVELHKRIRAALGDSNSELKYWRLEQLNAILATLSNMKYSEMNSYSAEINEITNEFGNEILSLEFGKLIYRHLSELLR